MGADEETAEKAVRQIIEELGLSAFQEEPTHALSGGQKKTGCDCRHSGYAS